MERKQTPKLRLSTRRRSTKGFVASSVTRSSFRRQLPRTKQTKQTYIMLEGQPVFVHEENKYNILSLELESVQHRAVRQSNVFGEKLKAGYKVVVFFL